MHAAVQPRISGAMSRVLRVLSKIKGFLQAFALGFERTLASPCYLICYRSPVYFAPRKCPEVLTVAKNKNNPIVSCSTATMYKRYQTNLAVGWNPPLSATHLMHNNNQ
jgi:hypothetical protein